MVIFRPNKKNLQGHHQLRDFLSHQVHQEDQRHQFHQCDQQVQSHHEYPLHLPFQGLQEVQVVQRCPEMEIAKKQRLNV